MRSRTWTIIAVALTLVGARVDFLGAQEAPPAEYLGYETVEMAIDAGPFESDTIRPSAGNVLIAARFRTSEGSLAMDSVRVIDPAGAEYVTIGVGMFSIDNFSDTSGVSGAVMTLPSGIEIWLYYEVSAPVDGLDGWRIAVGDRDPVPLEVSPEGPSE